MQQVVSDSAAAKHSARTASVVLFAVVVLIENCADNGDTGSVVRLYAARTFARLFLHTQGIVYPFFSMHT